MACPHIAMLHQRNVAVASVSGRGLEAPAPLRCCRSLPLRALGARQQGLAAGLAAARSRAAVAPLAPRRQQLGRERRPARGPPARVSASFMQQAGAGGRPARPPSLIQRWRALKVQLEGRRRAAAEALAALPPIAALFAAWAALHAALAPGYAAWAALVRWRDEVGEAYNEYLAAETKIKWRWSHVYAKEMEWWAQVPVFAYWFVVTLVYQAFIPVSFLLSIVAPLYFAWGVWDRWWLSPVLLASLAIAPLKWVPWGGGAFCWVWPGLL